MHVSNRPGCRTLGCSSSTAMSRYLPPHLRSGQGSVDSAAQGSRGAVQTAAKPSSGMQSRWAPSVAAGPPTSARPAVARDSVGSQSFRRLDQSSTQVLASPASDLKPRKATKEWSRPSQMEMLASVSRSGGDGQEGDAWVEDGILLTCQSERPCHAACVSPIHRREGGLRHPRVAAHISARPTLQPLRVRQSRTAIY